MKLDKLLEILLFGKNNEFMDNEKIEIKLQTRTEYYFDLIKKNVFKLGRIIVGLLIIAGTLYIGFYILLFSILLLGLSYLFKKIKTY